MPHQSAASPAGWCRRRHMSCEQSERLPRRDITSSCQCDRWPCCCESRWFKTTLFFFLYLLIYLFKSPLQTPVQAGKCWLQCCLSSRGVDMSVGLMFRAVKSIRCDASRFFFILPYNILQIIIFLTLAIWLWGDWLRCCFKKRRIPRLNPRRVRDRKKKKFAQAD